MTARQCFEGLLTELSKVKAPSMLLQDFNYFFNKALNQYINKRYNIYDVNQQTTDDLRVLKATAFLDVKKVLKDSDSPYYQFSQYNTGKTNIFNGFYEVSLPPDYFHLLNCICVYDVNKNFKCYNAGDTVQFAATRITADAWPIILNDFYNRPQPWKPYYYIHNVNQNNTLPTNPVGKDNFYTNLQEGTDLSKLYGVIPSDSETGLGGGVDDTENKRKSNFKRTITLGKPITDDGVSTISAVEREAGIRYGNPSNVRMEIRYGTDDSIFTLKKVFIDYLKTPQLIRLTQEQVNLTEDTSQIMEFPDYVCQEIINELVLLVMENNADPRLQTSMAVSQSIANPVQQQTQAQQ